MALTPAQRRIYGSIGALAVHARGKTNTNAATAAFLSKFELEVDPDGVLTPEERARRGDFARRAHFKRDAAASVAARSRR
jgi:hypothetical protein